MKKILLVVLIVLLFLGVGYYLFKLSSNPVDQTTGADLFSLPSDSQLQSNMKTAGLDVLATEGTAMHIHMHLDIIINGKNVTIPPKIGIGSNFISPIHVHDPDSIIHIESPVVKDFKLSQFFGEWGVKFDDNCIGTYCSDANNKLIVAVNGAAISDVRNYVFKAHDEIEVWYGPKSETPNLIQSFTFPPDL
jgi:hypothetical protein